MKTVTDRQNEVIGVWKTGQKRSKFNIFKHRFKIWFQKFNPFNYRIFIYNKATIVKVDSAGKVGYDGRYLFLLNDDGKPFRVQHSMTLIDSINEPTMAIVKLFVDLDEIIKIEK